MGIVRFLSVVLGMAAASAVVADDETSWSPQEAARTVEVRSSSIDSGYCLFRNNLEDRRHIFRRKLKDWYSYQSWDYRIQKGRASNYPGSINFSIGDNIVISPSSPSGGLVLSHKDKDGHVKTMVALSPQGGRTDPLWWSGIVERHPNGTVDEYFVYLLADVKTSPGSQVCGRAQGAGKDSCKILHIEYYDHRDTEANNDKPTVSGVVTDFSDECLQHFQRKETRQSSEGDGDHGPTH